MFSINSAEDPVLDEGVSFNSLFLTAVY